MMRGLLEEVRERGEEAISALWASEAGIYGRWGFGAATRWAEVTVRSREAQLRRPPGATGRAAAIRRRCCPSCARSTTRCRAGPGCSSATTHGWAEVLMDVEAHREGAGRLRALVCDGGYATYAVRKHDVDGRADDIVELRELHARRAGRRRGAVGPPAEALAHPQRALVGRRRGPRAAAHAVRRARRRRCGSTTALYVRLVDLPRALAQRTYRAPLDVVLEVADDVCPWNAGRWRLAADAAGATCEPTTAPADLALGVLELGAAYLGGTPLATLGAAGRVEEATPGALAAASHAFLGERPPWAFEVF